MALGGNQKTRISQRGIGRKYPSFIILSVTPFQSGNKSILKIVGFNSHTLKAQK